MIKKIAIFIVLNFTVITASANPEGGVVASGDATITQSPGYTEINQTSGQAIIDWHSFNIGANEQTHFQQPTGGVALNRIDPMQGASQIFGQLTATGRIILINQAGIFFGPGAKVDVVGIVASTSDITNANFLAGKYSFDQPSTYNGAIINQGTINAAEYGLVGLVGTGVSNEGTITARLGNVVLASGDKFTVDMYGDQMINFSIDQGTQNQARDQNGQPLTNAVNNSGTIIADGGRIIMSAKAASSILDNVINMSGIVQANSVSQKNGEIILNGGGHGIVRVAGKMYASGRAAGQRGGSVKVLGEKVGVMNAAQIDVSGDQGGGEILVGGNAHGAGPEQNAVVSYVDPDALLDASAITNGDGGNIVVWADDTTRAYGTLIARGGSQGGNGGFAETSGKIYLDVGNINIDLSAPHGLTGLWLLDPNNIDVVPGSGTSGGSFVGLAGTQTFTPNNTATPATVGADLIASHLGSANVTIKTVSSGTDAGNILIDAPITWTIGNTLTFIANGTITQSVGSTITNTSSGGISMYATNGITLNADINVNGPHGYVDPVTIGTGLTLTGTRIQFLSNLILNANLTLSNSDTSSLVGVSGASNLTKEGVGALTISTATTYTGATAINAGILTIRGYGSIAMSSGVSVGSGAIFNIDTLITDKTSIAALTGAGDVHLGENNILTITNASGTYSGVMSDTGVGSGFTLNSGTLTLTGANTYQGATTIASGATLQVGNGGTAGSIDNSPITNNGTLVFNRSDNFTHATMIDGTGDLKQAGTGILTLTAANIYQGTTIINSGKILKLSDSGSIENSLVVVNSGSTFDISGVTTSTTIGGLLGSGSVNLGEGKTLIINNTSGNSSSYSGVISDTGAGSALTLTGGGTQFLTGTNTYKGITTIDSGANLFLGHGGTSGSIDNSLITDNGALIFDRSDNFSYSNIITGTGGVSQVGAGVLTLTAVNTYEGYTYIVDGSALKLSGSSSIANSYVELASSGTFDISGVTAATTIAGLTGSGSVHLGEGKTLIINIMPDTGTIYGGVISDTGAGSALTLTGGGTQYLTGTNTYKGITTIDSGTTLQIGDGGTTGSIDNSLITDNGTLYFDRSDGFTFSNKITGAGSVGQIGTGIVTLTAANDYYGNTSIFYSGRTLKLSGSGSIANSLVEVDTGSTFDISGVTAATTIAGLTGSGSVHLGEGKTLIINSVSGNSPNYGGVISDTGAGSALTLTGVGSQILAGANTYQGITTIGSGATLQLGNDGVSGSIGAGNIVNNGTLAFDRSNSLTIANAISGTGDVEMDGTGTVILSGANAYTGNTTVMSGTLAVASNQALGSDNGAGVVVESGASLDFQNVNYSATNKNITLQDSSSLLTSTGSSQYSGLMTLAGSATINVSGFDLNLLGAVSGSGGITKIGTGDLVLAASNSYSGTTSVNAGGLYVDSYADALGTSQVNVASNATFGLLHALSGSVNNAIRLVGGAKLVNVGNNALSGAITVAYGNGTGAQVLTGDTLTISGALNGAVGSAGALYLGGAGRIDINNTIGSVTPLYSLQSTVTTLKINGGAITTMGNQTYTNAITLGQNALFTTGSNGQIALTGGLVDSGVARTLTVTGSNDNTFSFGGTVASNNSITVNGGSGFNTLDFSHYASPVYVTLAASNDGGVADVGNMAFNNINNSTGTGSMSTLDAINIANAKAYYITSMHGYIADPFYFTNYTVLNARAIILSSQDALSKAASLQNLNASLTAQTTSYLQMPVSAVWVDEQDTPTIVIKTPSLEYSCQGFSGGVCSSLFLKSAMNLQLSSNQ